MPASALPLAYYFVAYTGFAAALAVVAADPSLPAASFYQPRFIALVHLLTLAWLTGSILGSLYIVAPLVLRVPMPVQRSDWIAFGSFVFGMSGMVAHFWINTYDGMAGSALFVTGSIVFVGARLLRGLRGSKIDPGVRLHIVLAFFNIIVAAMLGMIIGFDRSRGFLTVSPLAVMFAHIHLAAVGFVTMLVIGLSYRLVPMVLPARMPSGRSIMVSAILIEAGLLLLSISLVSASQLVSPGALLIVCGLVSFIAHVRQMVGRRLPRPPALPARDWSTWQVHAAFAWLLVAIAGGVALSVGASDESGLALMWRYGVAGLVGFLAQVVAGMQGRLVALYAWYRGFSTRVPHLRPANALPSAAFARAILLCWSVGVPLLFWGLPHGDHLAIRGGALALALGVGIGGSYVVYMLRRVRGSAADAVAADTPAPPRTIPHRTRFAR